jgi:hypothetical protein
VPNVCAATSRRHRRRHAELVDECTATIVGEVESLKGLVDEFSQFARMPAPRAVPTDLHPVLEDALSLYRGLLAEIEIRTQFAESLPKVSIDAEQIRRVILNLVDNAIEAMDRSGVINIETRHDAANSLVRVVVADNGPAFHRPSAISSSSRITPPNSGEAALASPSSGASSLNTAAALTSPTTSREARASRLSYHAELLRFELLRFSLPGSCSPSNRT